MSPREFYRPTAAPQRSAEGRYRRSYTSCRCRRSLQSASRPARQASASDQKTRSSAILPCTVGLGHFLQYRNENGLGELNKFFIERSRVAETELIPDIVTFATHTFSARSFARKPGAFGSAQGRTRTPSQLALHVGMRRF